MAHTAPTWLFSHTLNELGASKAAGQVAPWLYQQRESFSAGMALLVLGALLISLAIPNSQKPPAPAEQTLQLELSPTEPAPKPTPLISVLPVPPQATRSVLPSALATPSRLTPAVTAPATTSEPARLAAPPAASSADARPVAAVAAVIATAETAQPATPALAAPAQPSPALQTSRYEAQILRYLESIKRYPSNREARLTRPAGIVTIWFELSRAGRVLDAGIEKGSNSSMLDSEALKTVRSGNFPQFPETVFANAEKHRFSAHLSYELKASE